MQGPPGSASKLETESAINAYHSGETFYLGNFSVQHNNGSLYNVLPKQAVDRLGIDKADNVDSFLDEETGAIITIPRGTNNGQSD